MSRARLATEFSFLVGCCDSNFATGDQSPHEIPEDLDWEYFVALGRRNRVQGLVWNALASQAERIPHEAREALSSDARSIAATNLGIAAECRALRTEFQTAGLPLLFVKGLTVGALAYRSPLLKMGWDIDLLINPADLPGAAKLLSHRGYMLRLPAALADLYSWHDWSKESVWCRDGGFHVELHTQLADNVRFIPSINVHSERQLVEVAPGTILPTLAEDELFAYLAVHGASSAWFRLKWISDFAGLLAGKPGDEIDRLYRRSQELGAARAAGQALLLSDRLFETLRAIPRLRKELLADRATVLLRDAALGMMTNGIGEPTERPLGTLAIHWTQLLLRPDLGYKLSELQRQGAALFRR